MRGRSAPIFSIAASLVLAQATAGQPPKDDGSFSMSDPVVCKDVTGYENYEVLPGAELTNEDKLLVYFRPRHFKIGGSEGRFEAHFTQDGKIRRRGEKSVVWQKSKMLDYHPKAATREMPVFLKNTVSLKTIRPGDYEFEITLRDEIGKSAPAVRTVPFKVIPKKSDPPAGADKTSRPADPR